MPNWAPMNILRALSLGAVLACTAQTPAASTVPVPWCATLPLPQPDLASLTIDASAGSDTIHTAQTAACRSAVIETPQATLRLAVAATPAQRARGLMGVPFLPARQGMLFAFADADKSREFWMKDTITPLDIVFVKADGTITTVAANVPATAPGTPDDQVARRSGVASYVIEVAAGEAAHLGLAPGVRLRLPDIPAQ